MAKFGNDDPKTVATGRKPPMTDRSDSPSPPPVDPAPAALPPLPRRPGPTAEDEAYDIRIGVDGTWYYHGSPIGRLALVKLFATVLRRDEAGDYWLITPAERGRIAVDDAPFVAVELRAEGAGRDQRLSFRTNLDAWATADADHPIRVAIAPGTGEPRPYILVRDRLEALIARSVYYELVERAVEENGTVGVWSAGTFFPLDR